MKKKPGLTLTKWTISILPFIILTIMAILLTKVIIDNAKWVHGKTGMKNVATAICVYVDEHEGVRIGDSPIGIHNLGLTDEDLGYPHFNAENYEITSITYKPEPECIEICPNKKLKYTITCTNSDIDSTTYTLDQEGGILTIPE